MSCLSEHSEKEPVVFETTNWSDVYRAGDLAGPFFEQVFSDLFRKYWPPLYFYLRTRNVSSEDAEDVLQDFFTHVIDRNSFAKAARERGRFRTFLLTALANYLSNHQSKEQTLKRGGKISFVSVDALLAKEEWTSFVNETPETIFMRAWAQTVLDQSFERLEREVTRNGGQERFDVLREFVRETPPNGAYGVAAKKLNITEGSLRVAIHRLRAQFADAVRAEVLQTVSDPAEVEREIETLFNLM